MSSRAPPSKVPLSGRIGPTAGSGSSTSSSAPSPPSSTAGSSWAQPTAARQPASAGTSIQGFHEVQVTWACSIQRYGVVPVVALPAAGPAWSIWMFRLVSFRSTLISAITSSGGQGRSSRAIPSVQRRRAIPVSVLPPGSSSVPTLGNGVREDIKGRGSNRLSRTRGDSSLCIAGGQYYRSVSMLRAL